MCPIELSQNSFSSRCFINLVKNVQNLTSFAFFPRVLHFIGPDSREDSPATSPSLQTL